MSSQAGRKGLTRPQPIPDKKIFFKIGEAARICGVQPYVLRYWETEFPQIKPRKGQGGQRVYRREDLETIRQIRTLLHDEGFTIAGARKHIRQSAKPDAPGTKEAQTAREGLRDLLDMMENTDAKRANAQADSGRGAAR